MKELVTKLIVRCNWTFLFFPVLGDGQKILSECNPSIFSGDRAHLFYVKVDAGEVWWYSHMGVKDCNSWGRVVK